MSKIEEKVINKLKEKLDLGRIAADFVMPTIGGQTLDLNTDKLFALIRSRADVGEKKYGQTLERTDFAEEQWIQHALEEALDLAGYATKLMDMKLDEEPLVNAMKMILISKVQRNAIDSIITLFLFQRSKELEEKVH